MIPALGLLSAYSEMAHNKQPLVKQKHLVTLAAAVTVIIITIIITDVNIIVVISIITNINTILTINITTTNPAEWEREAERLVDSGLRTPFWSTSNLLSKQREPICRRKISDHSDSPDI